MKLCNAILNTEYRDYEKLHINTPEGMFFDDQKNDISCTIENHFLVLIEHQTSVNNNMPFRCLSYVDELLNKLVEDKNKLYRKSLIKFPSPRFVVFYDGDEKESLEREMRLSEAFWENRHSLELIVTAYNINHSLKQLLLLKCKCLNEYSTLVGKIKEGIKSVLIRLYAIANAVKFCLANGIMQGYLEFHSEGIFNMLALKWDKDSALKAGFENGVQVGQNKGTESVALNLLNMGMSLEQVQTTTKLSLERIKELANQ